MKTWESLKNKNSPSSFYHSHFYLLNIVKEKGKNEETLLTLSRDAANKANLASDASISKSFSDGVSNIIIGDCAHTAIHTWPETSFVEISVSHSSKQSIFNVLSHYCGFFEAKYAFGIIFNLASDAIVPLYLIWNLEHKQCEIVDEKTFQNYVKESTSTDETDLFSTVCFAKLQLEKEYSMPLGFLTLESVTQSNAQVHGYALTHTISCALLAESHNIAFLQDNVIYLSISTCKQHMDAQKAINTYVNALSPVKVAQITLKHHVGSDKVEIIKIN